MGTKHDSDEQLLAARRGVVRVLLRPPRRRAARLLRPPHPRCELAADLTAETFVAALTARRRYDARTGRRLGRLPWKTDGALYPFGDDLIAVARPGAAAALVDPLTGRARWRASVRGEVHEAEVAGTRVYLAGTDPSGRERFWELDARTGRSLAARAVPGFSVVGVVPVSRDVWLSTLGGRVVVLAP